MNTTARAHRAAQAARDLRLAGRSTYSRDGYLIVRDALDPETLRATQAESTAICRGNRGAIDGVSPPGAADRDLDVLRRYLCIHFPHKLSSLMRSLASRPSLVELLTDVIGPNVK